MAMSAQSSLIFESVPAAYTWIYAFDTTGNYSSPSSALEVTMTFSLSNHISILGAWLA